MRKFIGLSLLAALLVILSASGFATESQTIKIGVLSPFSGSRAAFGEEMRRGMEIAVDIL
ncbi:MAG: branched-chain amino acid ABC transporter substrate-binding protein, partial [Lentisphaerae bacterium]|nr:branched-chain amino acid ABC transporter substrate-binding protein [Lentisphaerota bacterium]